MNLNYLPYAGLSDEESKRFAYKIGWDWNQPQSQKIKVKQFNEIKNIFADWIVNSRCKDLPLSFSSDLQEWTRNQLDNFILGDVLDRIERSSSEALVIKLMREAGIDDEIIKVFTFNNFPSSSYGDLHPTQFFTYS